MGLESLILPVKKGSVEPAAPLVGRPSKRQKRIIGRKIRRERRKNRADRRKEVRDGVLVSLSSQKDRRKRRERRRV